MRRIQAIAGVVLLLLTLWAPAVAAAAAPAATTVLLTVENANRTYSGPTAMADIQVKPVDGRYPTGKVTVMLDGGTAVASAAVSAGRARLALPRNVTVGSHQVHVRFDPTYLSAYAVGRSAVASLVVRKDAARVYLTGAGQLLVGKDGRVTVAAGLPTAPATGATSMWLDGVRRGEKTLSGGQTWFWVPPTLAVGRHTMTVYYGGSATQLAASASVTITVVKGTPRVRLQLNPAAISTGRSTTATVTLSGPWGTTPTGTVSILVDGRGYQSVPAAASRSITISGLPAGTRRISALYSGDAKHLAGRADAQVSVRNNPCPATARACIDLTNQVTWLQSGGEITYGPVPITSGRPGWLTPPGTFKVWWRHKDHISSEFNAPMPYSVFFNGGIAFHEGSLYVASHGCIHLSPEAARMFFNTLRVGDDVFVWGAAQY